MLHITLDTWVAVLMGGLLVLVVAVLVQKWPGLSVALRCQDAYSKTAYRSWPSVASALLRAGWTEQETETIMRSKITRWARDWSAKKYRHGSYPASVVLAYLAAYPLTDEIKRWTRAAFPTT